MITCLLLFLLFIGSTVSQLTITPDVTIRVEKPNTIENFPNGTIAIYIQKGSNLIMECTALNMPQVGGEIYWKQYTYPWKQQPPTVTLINTGMTSYDLSRFRVGQGRQIDSVRLEILTFDESYAGVYSCEVLYSATAESIKVERTVIMYDLPQISYTEFQTSVDLGKDVTFSCRATGSPKPTIMWKRIGGSSNIIKNSGVMAFGTDITLPKVSASDAGVYSCLVSNKYGTDERKFSLTVIHPPEVRITPNQNDAYQKVGCMLQLMCIVRSYPVSQPSGVKWSSTSRGELSTGNSVTVMYLESSNNEAFSIMRIYPTTATDLTDLYTCSADNSGGIGSSSVQMSQSSNSNPLIVGPYPCSGLRVQYSVLFFGTTAIVYSLIDAF